VDKSQSTLTWTTSSHGAELTPSWLAPPTSKPRPSLLRWLPNTSAPPVESGPRLLASSLIPITGLADGPMVPGPGRLPVIEESSDDEEAEDAPLFGEALAEVLASAKETIESTRRQALAESEREIVRLAMVIAERVIDRELRTSPEIVCGWVRQGVEALAAEDSVTAFVSPVVADLLSRSTPPRECGFSVVVDDRLPNTSCEVRGRWGRVNAGLLARLDAMYAALGLDGTQG
jgi:hypothetical protein